MAKRGWFLTISAILFGLLAISNFLKPVLASANTGFVFLGHRLRAYRMTFWGRCSA